MRIGVMVDRLEVGGVEKVAIQQVASLESCGHDAELVLLRGPRRRLARFRDALRTHFTGRVLERRLPRAARGSLPVPDSPFSRPSTSQGLPPSPAALVREGEFDVLLAHGTYTCLTAFAVGRSRGVPVAAYRLGSSSTCCPAARTATARCGERCRCSCRSPGASTRWLARRADLSSSAERRSAATSSSVEPAGFSSPIPRRRRWRASSRFLARAGDAGRHGVEAREVARATARPARRQRGQARPGRGVADGRRATLRGRGPAAGARPPGGADRRAFGSRLDERHGAPLRRADVAVAGLRAVAARGGGPRHDVRRPARPGIGRALP